MGETGQNDYSIPVALLEDVMPLCCTKSQCLRLVMINSWSFGVILMPGVKVKVDSGALY